MKKFFAFILSFVCAVSVFAAPFGLRIGMSMQELTEACGGNKPLPINGKENMYVIVPVKSHPDFEYYYVSFNESAGLYSVSAVSKEIKTNRYGTEAKNAFYRITESVSKTYGEPSVKDEIVSSSYYDDDDYWFYSLKEGSRELQAVWSGEGLKDGLNAILLSCIVGDEYATFEGNCRLLIAYIFENASSVKEEQDSVF